MSNCNPIKIEDASSSSETTSDNFSTEEKIQNDYDQLATNEEKGGVVRALKIDGGSKFSRKEIEKKIENKANELDLSKEKLIELANLDLESLNVENLKDLNCGSLEFIRDSIDEAINEIWKNKETGELVTAAPSNIDKLLKFTREHKKLVSLSELAIYASSFGPGVLKDLAGDDVKVEINGKKISLKDLADNPEFGLSTQATQEHFSQELADIYEEIKDLSDRNIKYGNLDESIEEANKFSDYAEFIQNSEKESIESMTDDLKEKGTNVLLFGEHHGPESNVANTVQILEKMQDDDHKITNIAFEFLSCIDPKAIESVEQFNNGEISAEDFYYSGCLYARSDIKPILEFAQDNNIPITGIETGKLSNNDLSRFTDISHRVGEIAEDNKEGEITAVFVGARHTTEFNFNFDDPFTPEYKEGREEVDEKDYTIKEYLEELGFKPAAINLDDWEEFAENSDIYFKENYNQLEEKDAELFGNHCMENWKKYQLEEKDVFAVNHGEGKNVYSIVNPGEITEVPSSLNAFKSIDDSYPSLREIMNKQSVFVICENDIISLEYNSEKVDVVQIDSETGQIEEIFLPEEKQHDDRGDYKLDYSKELTIAYNEMSEANEEKHEFKNLKTSIELAEEIFQYPEMIKSSEKILLDDFIKDLSKEKFDNLIIGEWHGFGPTEQEAAHIIEKLIKNNRNISAICLEGLSFEDPEKIEATKKFNEGKMSDNETSKIILLRDSLLKTARDNSIEIMGIETDEKGIVMGYKDEAHYDRFKSISEKIGEITEEKGEDGVVVTYIGQSHATIDSWKNDNVLSELKKDRPAYPQEKEALEKNYTIKEYLEKRGFDPIALQVEDWKILTEAVDSSLAQRFKNLSEEDRAKFYDFSIEKWKNYVLEESGVFITEYPDGKKNTFSVIIPSEIPKTPPILNGYKIIYDNPYLSEILNHEKISINRAENIEFSIQINGEIVPIIEIDKTTGEPIKMYLPEQAKDFQEDKKNRVFSWEKLKKILTEYDPRQYDRDHKIEGNKKLLEKNKDVEIIREERTENVKKNLEKAKDKLKKIYAGKKSENE